MKKWIAAILAVCIVFSLGFAAVSAESGSQDSADTGSLEETSNVIVTIKLNQGNIYNKDTVVVGALDRGNVKTSFTDFYTTDFERVAEGETYSSWQIYGKMNMTNPAVYDENKNYIQNLTVTNGNTVTIPEDIGAYYMRVSVGANQATDERQPRIVTGEESKPWTAYRNEETEVREMAESISKSALEAAIAELTKCYAYLPDVIYCAVGTTIDLYNNQVCINADRFHIQWVCSKGFAEGRRFTITADAVEDLPLTLNIYNNDNSLVYTKNATLKCVPPLTSGTIRVLPIGDSMTFGGATWQMEIQNNLSNGAIQFVGTQTTTFRQADYKHEGYNGITASGFLNSETHRGAANPFFNASTGGFDYGYYLTSTGIAPDAVMIELGTNDVNGVTAEQASEMADNIVELVRRIKTASSNTPVYVCNAIYRSNQDGIAHQMNSQGYSASSGKYKYNEDMKIFNLMVALDEKLADFTGVYTIPLALCHDSENNFGKQTIKLNSRSQEEVIIPADSVHPNKTGEDSATYGINVVGYLQFADVMFSVFSGTMQE